MSRLPGPREIQAALARTTRHLAAELQAPGDRAPDWSAFEWRTAMAVCAMHGISVMLANRLRWTGPEVWNAFLVEQRQQSRQREQRVRDLLARLDDAARREGIAMVGLKGSALLPLQVHAEGERPMGDVDLLVRPRDFEAARGIIENLGYAPGRAHWKNAEFVPTAPRVAVQLGERAAHAVGIDLHTRVFERLQIEPVEITQHLWPADPQPGLQPYRSPAALMKHLLLHGAGDLARHALRLVQLQDIVRLASGWNRSGWDAALNDDGAGPHWWALPMLRLAGRHGTVDLAPAQWAALQAACPRHLAWAARRMRIENVSYARADVQAFPGIAWCRTAPEAARYVARRIWPDEETRVARRAELQRDPASAATPWAALPQSSRILRWLCARPLRQRTVLALRLALDYRAP